MPYSYPNNVPDYLKNLPEGAQKLFISVFNSVYGETQDEDKARIAGWGAVKNKYEKSGEEWVRKAREGTMLNLDEVDTVQKAYAMHAKMHAEYLEPRGGRQRKVGIQRDHETIVMKILELGGKHPFKKGDVLDDTLSQELKDALKLRYLGDSIELSDGKPVISKIQILRTGTFHHPQYGKFTITDETLDQMVKNFGGVRPKAPTELVVDYEHLSAGEVSRPDQCKAAGWVKDLSKTDGKLFALVEWTEEAADAIRKKEFRFISPEFDLNYKDKESGSRVGPTLISVALTNRPFLEGMQPVVLSESLESMLFSEEVKMSEEIDKSLIGTSGDPEMCLAEWDTKYINDLPDSCFAYIKPGGEKDEGGKTIPRSLRYLPYKGDDGKVDLDHLRNALSRLPQTDLSPEEKAKAKRVLVSAAQEAGVGDYSELPGVTEIEQKEVKMEKKLREILGLGPDDDIVKAIESLKTVAEEVPALKTQLTDLRGKVQAAETKASTAEKKLNSAEAEKIVEDALINGKIIPKMKPWALDYVLRDPDGFKKFVEMTEKVGPDLTIKGKDTGETDVAAQPTEMELRIATVLGVSKEALIKAKESIVKGEKAK